MSTAHRANQITIAFCVVATLVLGGLVVRGLTGTERADADEIPALVLRPDSHRLGAEGDQDVTLVEFLDFECESCAAAYPVVEDLRERFAGRVTFVLRYFPIESHRNALNAAHAVEAAARQGRLEPMYQRMYATQAEWGEQSESKADLFRSFAVDLGLDMAQYDADVVSESVKARVQADVDDGTALGVTGTPTFFLNGERYQPRSIEGFAQALEDALAE